MRLIALTAICCFLWMNHTMAQEVDSYCPKDYSVIPPSPEVSALMKYIDFPVSPFTGQPDITIPLYTVREGSLEVPISISYHGGGIKANESPGIVGYGWCLNAGGCISRTVHGLPDELNRSGVHGLRGLYHLNDNDKMLRNSIMSRDIGNIYKPYGYDLVGDINNFILPESLCNDYDNGYCDMANDVMHFNFMGKSGTIIVEPNAQQLIVNSPSPIKIESWWIPLNGGHCVMSDEMHTKYLFDVEERAQFKYSYFSNEWLSDTIYCGSSWFLSKMWNFRGDEINLSYIDSGRKRVFQGYSTAKMTITSTDPHVYDNTQVKTMGHTVDYYCKRLHRIYTPSTSVEFIYDDNQEYLSFIKVCCRTFPETRVKCYQLEHSSDGLLMSICESGHDDSEPIKRFSFTYHDNEGDEPVDTWGYNGNSKNRMLRQITYATGGTTDFIWERNDYSYIGNETVRPHDEVASDTTVFELRPIRPQNETAVSQENVASNMFDNTYTFTVPAENSGIMVMVDLSTFMTQLMESGSGMNTNNSLYHYCHTSTYNAGTDPRVELYSPSGQLLGRWFIDDCQCKQSPVTVYMNQMHETGTYKLTLKYPLNWLLDKNGDEDLTPSVVYNYLIVDGTENASGTHGYVGIKIIKKHSHETVMSKLWGGWRIASIKACSGFFDPIIKNYEYRDRYNPELSSGTILEEPWFNSTAYSCSLKVMMPASEADVFWNTIQGIHSDGLFNTPNGGSHVEYPFVREIFADGTFCIDYDYDSQRDYSIGDVSQALFYDFIHGGARMNTSINHKCGNLLRKTYKRNGKPFKIETSTYLIKEGDSPWFCGDFHKITDITAVTAVIPNRKYEVYSSDYTTCRYQLIPYNKALASNFIQEYSQTDTTQSALEEKTTFDYFKDTYSENLGATFPKSMTTFNSDGSTETTYYKYLMGYSEPFNLLEVEVRVRDGKIVSAHRNVYDGHNNLVETYRAPSGLAMNTEYGLGDNQYAATEALKNAINLAEYQYQYDNDNNLVQVSWRGIPLATYLWGYQSMHPIAEIKNAAYWQVHAALPDGLKPHQLTGRYDYTPALIDQIRDALPGLEVTTITYDWLVGVGAITDSRGTTITFTRNGNNHLSTVRDWNNHIIQKNEYHYLYQSQKQN